MGTTAQAHRSLKRADDGLFAGLLVLSLLPLLFLGHFPTQDGAAHVANAMILHLYHDPAFPALRHYYTLDLYPNPNWTGHALLYLLTTVAAPEVAERILVAGILVLDALALRALCRAVGDARSPVILLALPLLYAYPLFMGFYSFCIAAGLAMLTLAVAWPALTHSATPRRIAVLLVLGTLLYFSHLLPWLLTVAALCTAAVLHVRARRITARAALLLLYAFVPGVLLALAYALRGGAARGAFHPADLTLRVTDLAHASSLTVFNDADRAPLLVLVALLAALTLRRAVARPGLWGAFVALLLACYLIVPEGIGDGYFLSSRLQWILLFCLIAWVSQMTLRPWEANVVRVAAATVTLWLLAARLGPLRMIDAQLTELDSAAALVPGNRTLLPVPYSQRAYTPAGALLSERAGFFLHATGYRAARGVIAFDNYEANTTHFPVRYRAALNPYRWIGTEVERDEPPPLRFDRYHERTPGSVDYVLIWRPFPAQLAQAPALRIQSQLAVGYERIHTSSPLGFATVYRRRATRTAPAAAAAASAGVCSPRRRHHGAASQSPPLSAPARTACPEAAGRGPAARAPGA